jgi:N-acetylmuramoyl-L-alanine amidase
VEQLGRGIYEAFVAYRKRHQTAAPAAPAETKRRKSRLAQELADVREGRAMEAESDDKPATIDADSIVNSEPESEEKSPLPAQQEKTSAAVPQPAQQPASAEASAQPDAAPVFKVQILASDVLLKAGSKQLKGQKDVDHYRDSGMYKYTVGASANYNEIYQLRKKLLALFPQAFIIAFKDGKRTDVQQAIREFKNRKQ